MKKIIFVLLLITAFGLSAQDLYISGSNTAEYIYKSADDSLKNYFEDELNLTLDYNKISLGLTFNAYLPKYDENAPIENLNSDDIEYEWEERYVNYSGDNIEFRAGTIEDYFGSGMTFRAYEDEDLDHDNRLEGFMGYFANDYFKTKAIYGVTESKNYADKNDAFYGLEASSNYDFITLGGKALGVREQVLADYYSNRKVYGSELTLAFDALDFYVEYAYSDLENINKSEYGHGLYTNTSLYVGDFTFTGGYKYFKDFDYRFIDLPTLNHADEPLDDYQAIGSDEEGFLGEISWNNSFGDLMASYAEAWSSDFDYKLSNGYGELQKEFGENIFTFEYEHFERKHKSINTWSKELTPAIVADIPVTNNFKLHLKTEYEMIEEVHGSEETEHIEPLLQTDFLFNNFGISIITEVQMEDLSDTDNADFWLGGEVKASIMDNTDLLIFAGKQKGGSVCRNGTCKEVKPFEGIKFEITTKF